MRSRDPAQDQSFGGGRPSPAWAGEIRWLPRIKNGVVAKDRVTGERAVVGSVGDVAIDGARCGATPRRGAVTVGGRREGLARRHVPSAWYCCIAAAGLARVAVGRTDRV